MIYIYDEVPISDFDDSKREMVRLENHLLMLKNHLNEVSREARLMLEEEIRRLEARLRFIRNK